MSKSNKNVVDPGAIIAQFGADTVRWFVLSDSPPERDVKWTAAEAEGVAPFLHRLWRLEEGAQSGSNVGDHTLDQAVDQAIVAITAAFEGFAFHKAIAQIYTLAAHIAASPARGETRRRALRTLALLMAPLVPHLAEDIWAKAGGEGLAINAPWPTAQPHTPTVATITVQVGAKGAPAWC